ncbi:RNA methyltransferase [Myxosarcina sp. GI1]|uniref:RNA methyltransferase n=1 Tax=Myxosarcina sp. GI1 TaxID=1541065 RepID=UPI0005613209|nr:RNA methyltransferase [Myxosarcina sp. GI1]
MNPLAKIKIVLVEPAGALNVGSIARVMKNMGLSQLILVNPRCDRYSDEAKKMAVHAIDVLENAVIVDSLPTALVGCQRAIATTVRQRTFPIKLESPSAALPWLLSPNSNTALIFGAEERGLSNSELKYAQRFVCIDSHPDYPSLNLAQAVAVCAYELYQSWRNNLDKFVGYVTVQEKSSNFAQSAVDVVKNPTGSNNANSANSASLEVLEAYYQHLEAVLLDIGYLYPHTATARMDKFRRLYNRAELTSNEVAMLRGILRQIQWSINNSSKTKE